MPVSQKSVLKVISGALINIGVGLLFLQLAVQDILVLSMLFVSAIVCLVFSAKIEDLLNNA
jgi:hypothetical protein